MALGFELTTSQSRVFSHNDETRDPAQDHFLLSLVDSAKTSAKNLWYGLGIL